LLVGHHAAVRADTTSHLDIEAGLQIIAGMLPESGLASSSAGTPPPASNRLCPDQSRPSAPARPADLTAARRPRHGTPSGVGAHALLRILTRIGSLLRWRERRRAHAVWGSDKIVADELGTALGRRATFVQFSSPHARVRAGCSRKWPRPILRATSFT
jgi:hypothetical protein